MPTFLKAGNSLATLEETYMTLGDAWPNLSALAEEAAPYTLETPAMLGNAAIWTRTTGGEPTLALLSSAKAPAGVLLAVHDLAKAWRRRGPILASGFHAPVENEALSVLLTGPQPVMLVLARAVGFTAGRRTRCARPWKLAASSSCLPSRPACAAPVPPAPWLATGWSRPWPRQCSSPTPGPAARPRRLPTPRWHGASQSTRSTIRPTPICSSRGSRRMRCRGKRNCPPMAIKSLQQLAIYGQALYLSHEAVW